MYIIDKKIFFSKRHHRHRLKKNRAMFEIEKKKEEEDLQKKIRAMFEIEKKKRRRRSTKKN